MTKSEQKEQLRIALVVLFACTLAHGRSLSAQSYYPEPRRDLSGYWSFELDRTDSGVEQKWFSRRLRGYIKLPGILQSQFQGDEITTDTPWVATLYDRFWFLRKDYKDYTERNVRVPFLSQPPKHYLGVAWYQRDIDILPNWVNRRVLLTLERPHWETTVWIDEKKIGSDRSLVAPHIYDLGTVWLRAPGVDEYGEIQVGIRDFRAVGNEFRLNDRPIYFRGTHHGGDFPLTGYPDTSVAYWKKLFETCRKWGLNHMRFHSWCPPEAAFQAADELGFYLQPEPGMWNEINPDTAMERMLYSETDQMIKAYGNHPSFMLLSASNEPKGKWKESLTKWVERYRKEDPRRLYTSGTGHTEREVPDIAEGTDYLAIQRIGPKLLRRESGWFGGDYRESLTDINIPVISHEVGQWVAYPDFDVIKKFTGYLKPGNFEIFRDSMKEHNLLEKNRTFAELSSHLQFECYKEEIEANLRTPGLSGFQLLDLHDYLGQGTALVGLLDPFWDPKFTNPEDFRDFCNSTVPLARLRQRIFTSASPFEVDVEIAHYGPKPLENMLAVWRVNDGGKDFQGEWPVQTIPIGKNTVLGKISLDLSKFKDATKAKLTVTVGPPRFFGAIDRKILPNPEAILDRLPEVLDPTVWAIDDWNRNYKLGVIFECVVGNGRLLISAIDVTKTSDSNPVLSQLRNALISYVRSDCFQPNVSVTPAEFRSLFFDTRIMSKLHATASVGGEPAGQIIDGDPNTYLLMGDQKAQAREQAEVVISFPSAVEMSGIVVMPRQNHREHEGDIKDYTVQISDDGTLWSDIARGEFPSSFEPHRVAFIRPIKTRHLKLVSLTGFGTDKTTSLSEIAIIYAGPKLDDKGPPIEYQRSRTATPEIDEGPQKPKAPLKPKP